MPQHIDEPDGHSVQTVTVGGSKFTYREAGKASSGKPTILLLHGIGSGSGSWELQFDDLKPTAHLVAWDAPGYGGTTPLDAPSPDASAYAEALKVFCNALGLGRFILIGHSLGAIMAARFAADNPEKILGMILAAPARGYGDASEVKRNSLIAERTELMERLGPDGLAAARAPILLGKAANPDMVELVAQNMRLLNKQGYAQAVQLLARANITEDLAKLSHPVTFIGAGDDTITPPQGVRDIAAATPKGVYHEIPGAGHVCYIDYHDAFNSMIRAEIANQIRDTE